MLKQTRLTKGKFYLIKKFLIEDIFHDKSVEDRAEEDRGGQRRTGMSWLSGISDRAESLLNQLDQGAANVLRKVSS